jgi:hypothetical protein
MNFEIACAQNANYAHLPSSLQVDPLSDVIAIPPGACLGLDDHFAMSTNAVRSLLMNQRDTETRHALELNYCQNATKIANAQRDNAAKALEQAGWWQRWAVPLIAAGTLLGAGLGLATGASLVKR